MIESRSLIDKMTKRQAKKTRNSVVYRGGGGGSGSGTTVSVWEVMMVIVIGGPMCRYDWESLFWRTHANPGSQIGGGGHDLHCEW